MSNIYVNKVRRSHDPWATRNLVSTKLFPLSSFGEKLLKYKGPFDSLKVVTKRSYSLKDEKVKEIVMYSFI